MKRLPRFDYVALAAALVLSTGALRAELFVVANENKVKLVNGAQVLVKDPRPDSISILDLSGGKLRLVAEVEGVPNCVVGPPATVAITPDETLALVVSVQKLDPANPSRQIPDNRMTVVDLKATPPRIIATLETGPSPSGVGINRQGSLALVGNRGDGTVSVFRIAGKAVTSIGSVQVADAAAGVRHPVFTPDGKRALVTRDNDHLVTVLDVDGEKVTPAGQSTRSGFKPYAMDINRNGAMAVVGNVGFLNADTDTVGVIDLRANPPRTVDVISVGQTPESLRLSPDGTLCAVVLLAGSTKPPGSPLYSPTGVLRLFRVEGTKLTAVAQAPIGAWSQGVAFSRDNTRILVTNMVAQQVQVFSWDGKKLTDTNQPVKVGGGPASIGQALR